MPKKFKRHQPPSCGREDSRHRTYDVKRAAHPELGPASSFRSSARWQKVREIKKQRNPLCEDPFGEHQDHPSEMHHVHHVIALVECLRLGSLERLGSHLGNLRSLCTHCHDRVERLWEKTPQLAHALFLSGPQMIEIFHDLELPVTSLQELYEPKPSPSHASPSERD